MMSSSEPDARTSTTATGVVLCRCGTLVSSSESSRVRGSLWAVEGLIKISRKQLLEDGVESGNR